MRKALLFLTALLLGAAFLPAQRSCGTMDHVAHELQLDPKIQYRRMEIENQIQNYIQQQQALAPSQRVQAIYNIPVVFHVVYNTTAENISDARLMEQLDVLNKDFRKLNTDANLVPSVWQPLHADCEINFCLATIDPNGQPTTGITRTSTSSTSFSTNDNVKYTSSGGRDAWPRNDYLNIWVCDLGSGLLGYAQFPGGAAATDGVVLDYAYTGVTGASAPYNLGRTATHEVGHWLNLYHIWGDDGTGCNGSDQVADTPNQAGNNGGCPSFPLTDNCTSTSPGVMFMNYMDYTNDACMYFFTNGQKARMQAVMGPGGSRNALASSNKCSGSSTVVANFNSNVTVGCAPLTVNFTSTSSGNPTTFSWNFGDPGSGAANTSTQQNPSHTYNNPGNYTVTLIASNGTSTDTTVQTSYVTVTGQITGVALPFTETFESGLLSTNNWTLDNSDQGITWEIVTTNGTTPGSKSCKMDFYNYTAVGQRDGLITRSLNLSNMVNCTLTFDHAYKRYYTTARSDSLIIYVSTNSCANNWTRVFAVGENGTQTFATTTGTGGAAFTPTGANQWCAANGNAPCYTINLNAFCGNNDVRVKFEGYNDYGNDLYLDNINIFGTQGTAPPVANFSGTPTTICAGSSVAFTDNSSGAPTSWTWNFGDPGSGAANTSTQQNPSHTYATAGTYTVTMTAFNSGGSNQIVRTNYITVRANPAATATAQQTTCGLNNGGVTTNVSSGTPGYTYLWSNGATTANLSNVGTGSYTVTVTDNGGCTTTASASVSSVTPPTANIGSVQHTSCGLANGAATASGTSGTPAYTYLWSTGATTAAVSGLAAGSYTVTLTDGSGCTATQSVTINGSTGITANTTANSAACGQSNGNASVSATGGNGSYTYLWSNGATTASTSNLAAGTYTVTVTSAGCTTTATATVSNSGGPTASIPTSQNTSCGLGNGSATASATGGAGPYLYSWSNGATTSAISGLTSGTYIVTVTDQNSCQSIASITIAASSSPAVNMTNVNGTSCGLANGSSTAMATGGSGSYTYLWSNGATTSAVTGLASGTYTVTVTDGSGCTGVGTTTIGTSSGVSASITNVNGTTCGQNDGSATVVATGGNGNFTFAWSNGANTATASNLAAGSYTVTVTDGLGCQSIANVTISSSSTLSSSISQQSNVSCNGQGDGSATVSGSGGGGSYTFVWSNGATTAAISNLGPGTYTVTVSDGTGCTSVSTVTISEPTAMAGSISSTPEIGSGTNSGSATVTATGGTTPYTYAWSNGATTATASNLAAGAYTVTVTDANGCTFISAVEVSLIVANDLASQVQWSIYPNPSQGSFWIDFDLPNMEEVQITVHNAIGQLVYVVDQGWTQNGHVQVRLPQVAEGIYHVELRAGDQHLTKKLLIQH